MFVVKNDTLRSPVDVIFVRKYLAATGRTAMALYAYNVM
jgi:hypothetical protein